MVMSMTPDRSRPRARARIRGAEVRAVAPSQLLDLTGEWEVLDSHPADEEEPEKYPALVILGRGELVHSEPVSNVDVIEP
jgi:hypothetical protein